MWFDYSTWTYDKTDQYLQICLAYGLWPGFCEAPAVYSIGAWKALLKAAERLFALGIVVDVLAYIDDTFSCCDEQHVTIACQTFQEELAKAGLHLRPDKCTVLIPSAFVEIENLSPLRSLTKSNSPKLTPVISCRSIVTLFAAFDTV